MLVGQSSTDSDALSDSSIASTASQSRVGSSCAAARIAANAMWAKLSTTASTSKGCPLSNQWTAVESTAPAKARPIMRIASPVGVYVEKL